ncbi:hypothetical protein FAF44_10705 [Nonomuraea sp. MG754425]|uniref:hypothetical protein n=1 Tax=Nonomuraea sp. MG754425 TaxID=2570319 RepID=UPI001F225A3E|nr:hypothetical protein [Nonomuraea sp. MG754425]MCF6468856.1 hypothetical protein [Nonomuraea sp. MG754425]
MEFQGWSDGLALRPRDYLGEGESLAAAVAAAGPLRGDALHLFTLGAATTMARLHLGGIAGLRLGPDNVMIGPPGQVSFAPGPRDSLFPASDVRDWADVIVFAATGHRPGDGADLDRLLPALRAVIDECRRPDAAARPSAVDLVRVLLGHDSAARAATASELLLEAERRTRPQEPAPYEESLVATPFWRKPAYLAGIGIGVAIVTVAAGAVILISGQASPPQTGVGDVLSAIGRRTATFRQVTEEPRPKRRAVAEGRLSFDGNAPATSYDMELTCGNDASPTVVSLVGSRGVAGGVPFDADRPPVEPCAGWQAHHVRDLSSPRTIKGLLDAAGPDVRVTGADGRTFAGSALAHRVRGEEGQATYAGLPAEGPVRFTLRVDAQGLPERLELRMDSRTGGPQIIETVYRDWRAFEAIAGETTSNG